METVTWLYPPPLFPAVAFNGDAEEFVALFHIYIINHTRSIVLETPTVSTPLCAHVKIIFGHDNLVGGMSRIMIPISKVIRPHFLANYQMGKLELELYAFGKSFQTHIMITHMF